MEYTSMEDTCMKLKKKFKSLTGLTCILKENCKYAQNQNLEDKFG